MTRYFMRDTPLRYLEQEMMTPPHFKPRGHGLYHRDFHYRPCDVECRFCVSFARRSRCPLTRCPYLAERMEAGVLGMSELMQDCFSTWTEPRLQSRLRKLCCQQPVGFFLNDVHRSRWQHWHERYYQMSDRNQAVLYLLTAYEDIWRRVIWHFDEDGFDFNTIRLSGIQPEQYSVYQAAKAISVRIKWSFALTDGSRKTSRKKYRRGFDDVEVVLFRCRKSGKPLYLFRSHSKLPDLTPI